METSPAGGRGRRHTFARAIQVKKGPASLLLIENNTHTLPFGPYSHFFCVKERLTTESQQRPFRNLLAGIQTEAKKIDLETYGWFPILTRDTLSIILVGKDHHQHMIVSFQPKEEHPRQLIEFTAKLDNKTRTIRKRKIISFKNGPNARAPLLTRIDFKIIPAKTKKRPRAKTRKNSIGRK
jgi:hypothetical protein